VEITKLKQTTQTLAVKMK